jgi:hypothetical protein
MKPHRPMNSASPTKKATPTSKKEGDQPIVEAAAKLLANDNSGGWMRSICRQFLCGSDVSPLRGLRLRPKQECDA